MYTCKYCSSWVDCVNFCNTSLWLSLSWPCNDNFLCIFQILISNQKPESFEFKFVGII